MKQAVVEHVNITVKKPTVLAENLCEIFDWRIRWSGPSLDDGESIHVGTDESYLAIYTHSELSEQVNRDHKVIANLNHIGIVVDDINAIEEKVKLVGYKPFSHRNYEPGERFYFLAEDGVEIEVVSYV